MTDLKDIYIGKVVKSNAHTDYVCQIYSSGEADPPPEQTDFTFGTFVSIEPPLEVMERDGYRLVGVIYNTLLMNPDFGSLGPRLSTRQEIEIFTPDYIEETATLVGILALGWCEANGVYRQGVPARAATLDYTVRRMDEIELRAFHCNTHDQPCLHYTPLLLGMSNPLVPQLLMTIIDRLSSLFPASRNGLAVMRNNVAWKSIVQPVG